MPLEMMMPQGHWSLTYLKDISEADDEELKKLMAKWAIDLRSNSSAYRKAIDGSSQLSCAQAGGKAAFGFDVYDLAEFPDKEIGWVKVYRRFGYNGSLELNYSGLDRVGLPAAYKNIRSGLLPWHRRMSMPSGTDGGVIILDSRTGLRWGMWACDKIFSPYFWTLGATKVFLCGGAWVVDVPVWNPIKNRSEDGPPADQRFSFGNCEEANGAGVIPRIPTERQVFSDGIPFALSAAVCSDTFDSVVGVLPAAKYERFDVSAGGVRFGFDISSQSMEEFINLKKGAGFGDRDVKALVNTLNAIRFPFADRPEDKGGHGFTIDLTGRNFSLMYGRYDIRPDLLWDLQFYGAWRAVRPPKGTLTGAPAEHNDPNNYSARQVDWIGY